MVFEDYLKISVLLLFLTGIFIRFHAVKRWGEVVTAMLLLSLTLDYIQYFSYGYFYYTLDLQGHIQYILSLASGKMPPPSGWQSQQPPLYYELAAVFYKVGEWLQFPDPLNAARLLSLLLYTGFLILSLSTLRYYLSGGYFVMASAIMLFWPDGFTYAGRISNDVGVLFSQALTFYLATRWFYSKQRQFLLYACCSAFVGIAIKGSGMAGLGAMFIIVIVALFKKQVYYKELFNKTLIGIGLLSISLNFGRIAYYRWIDGANVKWFLNLDLPEIADRLTANSPYNYLYFDVASFLRDPFFYSLPNGSEFFWNAFLKMLLFGEWPWKAGPVAAGISSALLLVILGYVLTYLLLKARPTLEDICFPALVMMVCMLGMLMAGEIAVPWPPQCNGRYIYGITVIFALFFSKAVEWHHNQGRTVLVALGITSTIIFSLTSIMLIVSEFYGRL